MEASRYLFDIVALLLAAVVLVPLLQRLGIPSVLGYLTTGVLLGPHTPGPIVDMEMTRPLAEFGVVFLLFAIGLELPLARLQAMRRYIFGLGLLQVAVTALALSGIAFLAGQPPQAALVIGTTLAFSSTATVLALLVERNEAVAQHGRIAISVLIFQDLAVVPVLALLPLLAGDSHRIVTALGLAGLKAGLAIAAIFVLGRLFIRPAYKYLSAIRNPEVFSAANLLLILAVAWLTAEAGMSMALGAFLAGLLLADSPYRHQVQADIEPFRGLLLGLFFIMVGMSIDLPFVAGEWRMILALTLGLLAIKTVIIAGLCHVLRIGLAQGLRIGLLLAQVGEFAFVVFGKAAELRVIEQPIGQKLVAAVALTMVVTPLLAAAGRALAGRCQRQLGKDLVPSTAEVFQQHVIIAGYGRVGRAVARLLTEHDIPYIALDLDAERVAKAKANGLPVYYGDASQLRVLRSVGIDHARAAVITVNKPGAAERTVAFIRQQAPTLTIVARAHDLGQERVLDGAGATAVVPETMEASFQMAGLVLRSAGIAPEDIDSSIQRHRTSRYGMLGSNDSGEG